MAGTQQLRQFLNLHPSDCITPLCLASERGVTDMIDNVLSIGAQVDFVACNGPTALMGACLFGRLKAVKKRVRLGAKLHYWGADGRLRSAYLAARAHPFVLKWLLVGRHMDQRKIMPPSEDLERGDMSSTVTRRWSGPFPAFIPLRGSKARNGRSSIEWLKSLNARRRKMQGQLAIGVELV